MLNALSECGRDNAVGKLRVAVVAFRRGTDPAIGSTIIRNVSKIRTS